MINESINQLLQYGLKTGLIEKEDKCYVANKLISILNLSDFIEQEVLDAELEEILASINELEKQFLQIMAELNVEG